MNTLSISQQYLLCTFNEKGKMPSLSIEYSVCLLAGGLIDLIYAKSLEIDDKKKLLIIGELDPELKHLRSLYNFIKHSKPMKVEDLASEYVFSLLSKQLNLLIEEIGSSLAEQEYVVTNIGGFLGKTTYYMPRKEVVDKIVESIRAELLETGPVSEDMIALVSLLAKSGQLNKFFSKYENDQLKVRIKEMMDDASYVLVKEMVDYIDFMMVILTLPK